MSGTEYFLVRMFIEDRMREANQLHLAREVHRSEQPSPTASPVRKARRRSRLWRLVQVRQAAS